MSSSTHIPVRSTDGAKRTVSAIIPGTGLVVAVAALAGASCCVLPLLLAAAGVGSAWIAQLAIFVTYQWYILVTAIALVPVSWIVAVVRGSSKRAKIIVAVSTVLVVAAVVLPNYEGDITRQLLQAMRS